ncbi:MAG: 50S ribosomal protein L35 [Candidatus Saccharimonadales bacterium]
MPKLKTHSGTKDRFKITKNGKVLRRHSGVSHKLTKKSAGRKRRFAGLEPMSGTVTKTIKKVLGV